jgi:hypothetical protein
MRLHRLWRGTTENVYPTGRGDAGVQQGDGRSGGSQSNQTKGLVPEPLAGTSRCLESLGQRRVHVGRTTNMVLVMPRHPQLCDVDGLIVEKQLRGDRNTGKRGLDQDIACETACLRPARPEVLCGEVRFGDGGVVGGGVGVDVGRRICLSR